MEREQLTKQHGDVEVYFFLGPASCASELRQRSSHAFFSLAVRLTLLSSAGALEKFLRRAPWVVATRSCFNEGSGKACHPPELVCVGAQVLLEGSGVARPNEETELS